jgi:hypothetical protein
MLMAKSGQWISHILHLVQRLVSTSEIFPLPSRAKTLFGHNATQMPQLLHHFCRRTISAGFKWDRLFIFSPQADSSFRLCNMQFPCHIPDHVSGNLTIFHMHLEALVSGPSFLSPKIKQWRDLISPLRINQRSKVIISK